MQHCVYAVPRNPWPRLKGIVTWNRCWVVATALCGTRNPWPRLKGIVTTQSPHPSGRTRQTPKSMAPIKGDCYMRSAMERSRAATLARNPWPRLKGIVTADLFDIPAPYLRDPKSMAPIKGDCYSRGSCPPRQGRSGGPKSMAPIKGDCYSRRRCSCALQ